MTSSISKHAQMILSKNIQKRQDKLSNSLENELTLEETNAFLSDTPNDEENKNQTQIIIIRKKRKRETTPTESLTSNKKAKNEGEFNISQRFESLSLHHKPHKKKEKRIKVFSDFNLFTNTSTKSNETNSNLFKNFYPVEIPPDYWTHLKEEAQCENMNALSQKLSKCRQFKFLEKRGLVDRDTCKEFAEIKSMYSKYFGEARIIQRNEDIVIINNNQNKRNLEEFLESDTMKRNRLSYKVYELDKNMTELTDLDYLNHIKALEKSSDDLVMDSGNDSDSNNPIDDDIDSNDENNPNFDYPDEEESQREGDSDDYGDNFKNEEYNEEIEDDEDYPNMNTVKSSNYMDVIKNYERNLKKLMKKEEDKLNKAFIANNFN